jgi:hypothetical protein
VLDYRFAGEDDVLGRVELGAAGDLVAVVLLRGGGLVERLRTKGRWMYSLDILAATSLFGRHDDDRCLLGQ